MGTHFQVRNNPLQLERKSRVERDCNNLKKDIEQWIILMKATPSPDLLVVLDGYERFKWRIQRVSEEAILRRLSSEYTFQLSGLLVQLQSLKKRADKRDRRTLNNPKSRSSSTTDKSGEDNNDVFDNDVAPPPSPPRPSNHNIENAAEGSSVTNPIRIDHTRRGPRTTALQENPLYPSL